MHADTTDSRAGRTNATEPAGANASPAVSSIDPPRTDAGARAGRTVVGLGYVAITASASIATVMPTAMGISGCYPEQVSRAIAIVGAFTIICGLAPGVVLVPFFWQRISTAVRVRATIIPVVVLAVYGMFTLAWSGTMASAFREPSLLSALLVYLSSSVAVVVSTALMAINRMRRWVRVVAYLGSTAVLTVAGVVGVLLLASTGKCG